MDSDGRLKSRTGQDSRIVFVVDDDADSRESLVALMRSVGVSCESFASPLDFIDSCNDTVLSSCAVVVLDVRLPYMGGLEVLHQIKQLDPDMPIVMITGYGDVASAVAAIKRGAVDYLEKPVNPQFLLDLVQNCLNERSRKLEERHGLQEAAERCSHLSAREYQVAELVCQGMSNKQIADQLNLSDRTVEKHRIAATTKLGVDSTIQFVKLFEKANNLHKAVKPRAELGATTH